MKVLYFLYPIIIIFFFFCFVNILGKFGKKFIVAGGGGVQTVSRVTVNKAICFRIRSKLSNYFNFFGVQAETPIFWPGYYAKVWFPDDTMMYVRTGSNQQYRQALYSA